MKNIETSKNTRKVEIEQLRQNCDETIFTFETTKDIQEDQVEIIGQERAQQAMDFGLTVDQKGYNIYVAGPYGSGKTTYTKQKVAAFASNKPVPQDWCYVYNFEDPDQPIAIPFAPGKAKEFHHDIKDLLHRLKEEINRVLTSDEFSQQERTIVTTFEKAIEDKWEELETFANQLGFTLEKTDSGINAFPFNPENPEEQLDFQTLGEEEKEKLKSNGPELEEKLNDTIDEVKRIESNIDHSIIQFVKETVEKVVTPAMKPLLKKYKKDEKVSKYLEAYAEDIIENYSIFIQKKSTEGDEQNLLAALMEDKEVKLTRYTVNAFVNNGNLTGAPVIYETNPTIQNLMGKIEYKGALGNLVTDFSQVKPGSLHASNGGYLILQASQLFKHNHSWSLLKRILQTGEITVEDVVQEEGVAVRGGIKPEAIPLNVKVILIGPSYYFDILSMEDEEFYKLFKVKVEFHAEMERDLDHMKKMAMFVKTYGEKEGLLPFHRRAVARVIEYSSRLVEDQRRMSTQFHDLTQILVESSYWAEKENHTFVDVSHIRKAILEQNFRSNYSEEQLRRMITDGTIMVDVTGKRVGQINGLAVMGTREHRFGMPSRITAQTYTGKTGIVNIERETSLSGDIHSKGLLILSGYLSGMFAKKRPLPLAASITFEQTYNMIDGDSASSTELYVLLSSLSDIPIDQGIAVTGSVNQWGEIQPIGGVNEKIEGFYMVCKEMGLTGEQGVIIPHQNVKNLMLKEEVVDAVQAGQFHIWAIYKIEEGIEILTGVSAGQKLEDEAYPEGTVFKMVDQRIQEMYQSLVMTNENK